MRSPRMGKPRLVLLCVLALANGTQAIDSFDVQLLGSCDALCPTSHVLQFVADHVVETRDLRRMLNYVG